VRTLARTVVGHIVVQIAQQPYVLQPLTTDLFGDPIDITQALNTETPEADHLHQEHQRGGREQQADGAPFERSVPIRYPVRRVGRMRWLTEAGLFDDHSHAGSTIRVQSSRRKRP
jgi:hypothetical protein